MEFQKRHFLMDKFERERRFLQYGNFYPSPGNGVLNIIFGTFMFVYSLIELASMVTVLFFELHNLPKLSETLLFCMTQVAFMCKLTNFIFKRGRMAVIEEYLKSPIFNDLNQEHEDILDSYIAPFRKLSNVFRLLCVLCVVFYGLFPFIDNNPEYMLPLPGWFPFDIKTYQYEILLGQVLGIAIGAFNNSNIDILTAILMTLGSAQCDILKDKLTNAIKSDKKSTIQRLTVCCKNYILIERYVAEIQDLFSVGIFIQFACSVMVICLTGFQMLMISFKSIQFILLMIYFSTMTCQIILYCWYGNELIVNSAGISEACYMSNWNESDKEVRQILWVIMERGKRPVTMKAGNFFSLSLPTLMAILRSSYSYFALLQRLYGKST